MSKNKDYLNINTILDEEVELEGQISFKTSLKIDGSFSGKIDAAEGLLIVGEKAKVKADLKTKTIIIAGHVTGNCEASEKLEMYDSAKLNGNIRTRKLKIADGVLFEGACEMIK